MLPGQENGVLKPRLSGRARSTPRAEYLAPQRSSRRTPAAELPPQKSSRRTPAAQRRAQSQAAPTPATELLPQQSTGRSASASISRKRARSTSQDVNQNGLTDHVPERSTKKQRRDRQPETVPEDSAPNGIIAASTSEPNGAPDPASSGKKRKKRKSIGQQSMRKSRPVGLPPHQPVDLDTPKRRGRPKAANQHPPDTEDLENTIQDQLRRENADLNGATTAEPDDVVLQSVEPIVNTGNTPHKFKRKKRVSIGQQSGRKARHGLQPFKEEPAEGDATMDEIPPTEADLEENEDEESQHDLDEEPIAKPAKESRQDKPKRKKRKSIGQQRPKRPPASSPGVQPSRSDQRKRVQKPAPKTHTKPVKPPPRREASEDHASQASASASDQPPPPPTKRARGRPSLT